MLQTMSRNWWTVLLRGIFFVVFGLLALLTPSLTLPQLMAFFGVFALAVGVTAVFTSFNSQDNDERWWLHLIDGAIGVLAGIGVLISQGIAAMTLLFVIAAWAVLIGIMQIIGARRLRQDLPNEWLLGFIGVLSVVFGIFIYLLPSAGALALAWLIGLYALVDGALFIALGFRLHSHHEATTHGQTPQAAA